ncbi:MAG: hypothetical protein K2K42_01465 [Eubacterium sp.]|nr:hypothetical protein [Eubacterium sp.]
MKLLEKFQEFFENKFDVKPKSCDLTSAEWKLLIKENLTPIIEKELQMKQLSDYVWASDYEDGKRKVLSFFFINDAFATFKWGWNFDFIPKISGNKAVWARTDKSIHTHIFEVSPDFENTDQENRAVRDKTIISRYDLYKEGLEKKIRHYKEVLYFLLPLINAYYSATDSYEKILNRIDMNMESTYYQLLRAVSLIPKAFIEERMGKHKEALEDFNNAYFDNEKIKDEYYKKLLLLQEKSNL